MVSFLSSFIKNKAFALFLGVTGIGIISQLSNFISFLNYLIPLGIPSGLSKYISEKEFTEKDAITKLFMNSLYMVLIPTFLFSISCFFFSAKISELLFDNNEYSKYIEIISIFIPFIVLNSILEGFLRGLNIINTYVKVNIFTSILSLFAIIPLVLFLDLYGALLGVLSIYVVYVITSSVYLYKVGVFKGIKNKMHLDKNVMGKILKVSLVFVVSGALFQFTLLMIRKLIITDFGLYYNGIYQSTIAISLNYFGFIFLSLSSYSFPTISKLKTNDELNNELNINIRYIILIMVPLILLLYVFRYVVISILYTSEFLEAQKLYIYQFSGDYFKALSWAIGIWLIPKLKLKSFLILELILNLNLLGILYLLLYLFPQYLEAISVSYLFAYIVHFILNFLITKRSLNFKFTSKNNKLFKFSFLFFIPVLLLSLFNPIFGYILIIPALLLWIKVSTERRELNLFKEYVFSKIK